MFHQAVGGDSKVFVYSAYIDDRVTPRISRRALPVVRIFSYFPKSLAIPIGSAAALSASVNQHDAPVEEDVASKINATLMCLFWRDDDNSPPSVVPVLGYVDLNLGAGG